MAVAREAADGLDAMIHTANVFKRVDDPEEELVKVNIQLVEAMVCACSANNARLVLTSSMAAVRGAGQRPLNGKFYTTSDWNIASRRDGPGFEPYQFSKMEGERRAFELAKEVGLDLVTICPPMIFGPPRDPACASFSVQMVREWAKGNAPVRSLLVSDVRDVALAHLNAAVRSTEGLAGARKRLIVGLERRSSAESEADAVRRGLMRLRERTGDEMPSSLQERVHFVEEEGQGGAIAVGDQEVDAAAALWDTLGMRCRPSSETLEDMVAALDLTK